MNVSLIPEDNKNIFSLSYRSRFNTGNYNLKGGILNNTSVRHTGPGNNSTKHFGKEVIEIFEVFDLSGLYYINDKLNIRLSVPFIHNKQYFDKKEHVALSGIGDPILLSSYELFNSKRSLSESKIDYKLMIGGGVKLPFGSYKAQEEEETIELDLQAGTGSVDFVLTSDHIFKYKGIGAIINTNLKLNTKNSVGYRYGSSWNQTLNLFYIFNINKSIQFMPNGGVYFESANQDYSNNELIIQSGGEVTLASMGLNLYFNKIRIDVSYQQAINNNMNGTTQLNTKRRILAGVLFYIN